MQGRNLRKIDDTVAQPCQTVHVFCLLCLIAGKSADLIFIKMGLWAKKSLLNVVDILII